MTVPRSEGRPYGTPGTTWARGRELVARDGVAAAVHRVATYPRTPWIRFGWAPLVHVARTVSRSTQFEGPEGRLRYGPAIGERTIELPIAGWFISRRSASGAVLEVGRVLDHAAPFPHTVVDRYEAGPGVLNVDVVDYDPPARFPSIVSVSTLEHVGFDEEPPSPGKFVRALHHLRDECLAPGGEMLVTVPLGYNPEVDAAFLAPDPAFGRRWVYRHRGLRNLWDPVPLDAVPDAVKLPRYDGRRHVHAYVGIGWLTAASGPSAASQPSSA